jgi:hypothetical protein
MEWIVNPSRDEIVAMIARMRPSDLSVLEAALKNEGSSQLVTIADSDNDKLWTAFCSMGLMELVINHPISQASKETKVFAISPGGRADLASIFTSAIRSRQQLHTANSSEKSRAMVDVNNNLSVPFVVDFNNKIRLGGGDGTDIMALTGMLLEIIIRSNFSSQTYPNTLNKIYAMTRDRLAKAKI